VKSYHLDDKNEFLNFDYLCAQDLFLWSNCSHFTGAERWGGKRGGDEMERKRERDRWKEKWWRGERKWGQRAESGRKRRRRGGGKECQRKKVERRIGGGGGSRRERGGEGQGEGE
jgi:hypothetical protein